MGSERGELKRSESIRERGVDLLRASLTFRGPVVESMDGRRDYGEVRYRALGEVEGQYFVVVYTWRGGRAIRPV